MAGGRLLAEDAQTGKAEAMMDTALRELLLHCADVLDGIAEPSDHGRSLLTALGYAVPGPASPSPPAPVPDPTALLFKAAARFDRLFELTAPDAPGLRFYGAQVPPLVAGEPPGSASGAGLSPRAAFESCVGEGVEYASQFAAEGDLADRAPVGRADTVSLGAEALLAEAKLPDDTPIDWVRGRRIGGGPVLVPADLCLRRGNQRQLLLDTRLSIGTAAGPTREAAMIHGLLELIERDAAALWWRGGSRGRLIPLDHASIVTVAEHLAVIRRGQRRRRTWLLDITTDLGVPVVASLSVGSDGFGFACGLAARPTLSQAANAAVQEMCQMELAHVVVAAKRREAGDSRLNEHDRAHLLRQSFDVASCALAHPMPSGQVTEDIGTETIATALGTDSSASVSPSWSGVARPSTTALIGDEKDADGAPARAMTDGGRHRPMPAAVGISLDSLVSLLAARNLPVFVVDLTRPQFNIAVTRMICPGLEKEPSHRVGTRLSAMIAQTGGGAVHTKGMPLM